MKILSMSKLFMLLSMSMFISQTSIADKSVPTDSVFLAREDAERLIKSWERVEKELQTRGQRGDRAPRPDGQVTGDPAAPVPFISPDLDEIRRCVCIIKDKVCNTDNVVGDCLDETISTVTGAACITVGEINEICATVISWLKTIVSELRGNQETCPAP